MIFLVLLDLYMLRHIDLYIYICIYIYIYIYISYIIYKSISRFINLFHVGIVETSQKCEEVKVEQWIKKIVGDGPDHGAS